MRSPASALPVAIAGALLALVAAGSGRVFELEHRPVAALVAPVAMAAVVIVLPDVLRPVRFLLHAGLLAGATTWAVVEVDGELPGALVDALVSGLATNVAAPWPVPLDPAAVGGFVAAVALTAAAAVELASSRLPAPVAAVPVVALVGLLALLSAPAGAPPTMALVALGVGLVALVWSGERQRRRRTAPRVRSAGRRTAPDPAVAATWAVAAAGVVLAAALLGDLSRWDPRPLVALPPDDVVAVSPLALVGTWRSEEPAQVMFRTSGVADRPWKLVALTRYDGRAWMPGADYRPVGRQLRSRPDEATTEVQVELDRLRSSFLPAPSGVVQVSEPVSVDEGLGGLLLDGAPPEGFEYEVVVPAVEPSVPEPVEATEAAPVLVDEATLPTRFVELATAFTAGGRDDRQRAQLLAARLQRDFAFDPEAPAGHSLLVLDRFLAGEQAGREEQFVASYALLADAVGLPVRIVVGFDLVPDGDGGAIARSDQARAWPEVHFEGAGWVAFDPVPGNETVRAAGAVQALAPTPADAAATPPPTGPPPPTPDPDDADASDDAAEDAWPVPPAVPAAGSGVLLLLGGYVGVVLALKHRRRRRRRASPPDRQVTGAFESGIESLIDLGGEARRSATHRELVSTGAGLVPGATRPLYEVGDLATEAVFGREVPTGDEADLAWDRLDEFERSAARSLGRWRWARARLSLRSLRRRP